MFGDPCTGPTQCQSNLCIGAIGASQGICTVACTDESQCNPSMACLAISGVKVCVPSDSGHACPNGSPAGCFAGVCLGQTGAKVCSTPCDTTRACPQNMTCSPAAGVNGRWCIPAGQSCSGHGLSSTCTSNFCEAQAQNASDGVCTSLCRDHLDCPPDWACGLDDDGTGNTLSLCQPVGQQCTVNGSMMNDCYSQSCDTGRGLCTALCMNTSLQQEAARCPTGWTCSAFAVGSQTWYACEAP
jgi:hypothetical protein